MSMRRVLPAFHPFAAALVLNKSRRRSQAAVFLNRQTGNAATAVVCGQDVLPLAIHSHMRRPRPARGLTVKSSQLACLTIHTKGTDLTRCLGILRARFIDS